MRTGVGRRQSEEGKGSRVRKRKEEGEEQEGRIGKRGGGGG